VRNPKGSSTSQPLSPGHLWSFLWSEYVPASFDTVESEGAADEAVLNIVLKKKSSKNPPFDYVQYFKK
jgi:hypothetical protein